MDAPYLDFSITFNAVSHIIPIARFVEIPTANIDCKWKFAVRPRSESYDQFGDSD